MSGVGEMIVTDRAGLSVKLLRRGLESEWKEETVGGSAEDVVVDGAGGERR